VRNEPANQRHLLPCSNRGFVYLACVAAYDTIVANAGKQAVPIINKSTFSAIEVPALSQAEMIEISAMVDAIDGEIVAAQTSLDTLHRTKANLMSDLLSGRVREGPMSEYRLAEKPALDALVAMGWQALSPAAALAMRVEENRVILKPVLIAALRDLNSIGEADAEAIYADLATLSDKRTGSASCAAAIPAA
jgi:hypothetical protein